MIGNLIQKAKAIAFNNKNSILSATNVQDAINEIGVKFCTDSYSNGTQTFNLPTRHSALLILSTAGTNDLFIVSAYDESNSHVTRLSSNMSTFSVTIKGNTVTVGNSGYWFKYVAVIL